MIVFGVIVNIWGLIQSLLTNYLLTVVTSYYYKSLHCYLNRLAQKAKTLIMTVEN